METSTDKLNEVLDDLQSKIQELEDCSLKDYLNKIANKVQEAIKLKEE